MGQTRSVAEAVLEAACALCAHPAPGVTLIEDPG